jgi:hypothetical protein
VDVRSIRRRKFRTETRGDEERGLLENLLISAQAEMFASATLADKAMQAVNSKTKWKAVSALDVAAV